MPNPENIVKHKFKKGQSGNPKGRPKLPDLKGAIAKIMSEDNGLDSILKALLLKAKKGDVRAAQELLDRGYGKAMQTIQQENTHKLPESYDSFIDRLTGNAKPKTD